QRRGEADVVGVGLKGESEHGNALALDDPQGVVDFLEEAFDALLVDALGGLEHFKVNADRSGEVNEGLNVFRKAEPAEAQTCLQELGSDAGIEPHGVSHFLDIGANALAEIGNDVGIADFQGQEGIRSMLDQFGAVDGGDEQLAGRFLGAPARMNGAVEFPVENGLVDFAEPGRGGGVFHADDDAVRMKKIANSRAFAEKLWIGSDLEFRPASGG